MRFSILLPTYNGGDVLGETLKSVLNQSFTDYELIVCDDASTDNTVAVVAEFADERVKLFENPKNLGYPANLESCRQKAVGEIFYLMGQDDILAKDALLNTHQVFLENPEVGAVTRPFFWFERDLSRPNRATPQLNPERNEVVRITDDFEQVFTVFDTLGQLSGLALRKKFIDRPFHPDIFPCHIYPFAAIFKNHPIVFLKDYTVAVRTESSQTRTVSSIYEKSPLRSWVEMFENVFPEPKFREFREYAIKNFLGKDYLGLVQLRNFARYRYLLREIGLFLKYRPLNLLDPRFWFFSLGTIFTPRFLLTRLVDWYKKNVESRRLGKIEFEYEI